MFTDIVMILRPLPCPLPAPCPVPCSASPLAYCKIFLASHSRDPLYATIEKQILTPAFAPDRITRVTEWKNKKKTIPLVCDPLQAVPPLENCGYCKVALKAAWTGPERLSPVENLMPSTLRRSLPQNSHQCVVEYLLVLAYR